MQEDTGVWARKWCGFELGLFNLSQLFRALSRLFDPAVLGSLSCKVVKVRVRMR